MLDQYGNHIPGTVKAPPPLKAADYEKVAQNGDESFFIKRNPQTGVITKMIYDRKTGTVKVRKSVEIAPDLEKAKKQRNHAAGKRAYAGSGKHQMAYMVPHIIRQEMIDKISGNGFEYDQKEFYKMLDGTSRYGDYSAWKVLRGKMPNLKKEI